ncbi:MAG: hypothetical protein HY360_10955 [Verrucomicrobia bacterium]|nr:hypothetical protein [Verrucomicrobiota bacterium]
MKVSSTPFLTIADLALAGSVKKPAHCLLKIRRVRPHEQEHVEDPSWVLFPVGAWSSSVERLQQKRTWRSPCFAEDLQNIV